MQPVGDATFDRGNGGKMKASGDAIHRAADDGRVSHVSLDQLDIGWQVLSPAGGQIVQRAHRVATAKQGFAGV